MPTADAGGGGGRAAIQELLRTYQGYSHFRPGVELANQARRTHDTIGRASPTLDYWTRPGRPLEAPAYDFWPLWGVLR
jgi:hypothetical protein